MIETVGIRFKDGGKIYDFDADGIKFNKDDYAMVETVRGIECGKVAKANHGVSEEWYQSDKIQVEGFVCREVCREVSNWGPQKTLDEFLKEFKTPGISGIDTLKRAANKINDFIKSGNTNHSEFNKLLSQMVSVDGEFYERSDFHEKENSSSSCGSSSTTML